MKVPISRAIYIGMLLTLLAFLLLYENVYLQNEKSGLKGTISLSGAWAVYPTAVAWSDAFKKLHPDIRIDVSAGGAGKGAADVIANLVDIGMVSRDPDPSEIKKGIIPIYILHDAVYSVISGNNPALKAILKKGIKKQALTEIYISGTAVKWNDVVGEKIDKSIHVYTRSDSCGAASTWAKLFGKKQEDLKGIGIYGDPGILEAVKRDMIGIGYSNFSYVFTRDGSLVKGVKLIPIDTNENGIADPDEIYDSRDEAVKAIRSGKYPVTRKNYFFVKGKLSNLVKEFIKYCLSEEGTKIVDEVGTSLPLTKSERDKVLKELE